MAIGDAQVSLPKTVDLKMELEEKDGQVEFELELKWPLHPQEEAETEGEAEEPEEGAAEGGEKKEQDQAGKEAKEVKK